MKNHIKGFGRFINEENIPDESGGSNPVLENPLYQSFYDDIMGVNVTIISKSSNSIKIDAPTGVWILSKSNS